MSPGQEVNWHVQRADGLGGRPTDRGRMKQVYFVLRDYQEIR